ncbi:uncharacterized protein L201_004873 [Kwoniella dendrophila CBS 6074]|uniref:protein-tyrosine-phosphatase n=1 Tax=Kwoniella dendrophila CBS 6074 TaxID=1295534 RepID=A0AAX4JYH9_9TREE
MSISINTSNRGSPQTYRSTPPPPTASSSSTISKSTFYPGFLSSNVDDKDEFDYPNGSPSSSSSKSSSPISPGLPYLVESPQAASASSSSSTTNNHPFHQRIPSPIKVNHDGISSNDALPVKSKSIPLGIEVGKGVKSPGGPKKRPLPLNLGKARETMGLDEEMVIQRDGIELQRPLTASSVFSDSASSLSNDLQDLSFLRKTVRQNLKARPLDSPLPASDSERESNGFPTPELDYSQQQSLIPFDGESITIDDTVKLLQSSPQLLVIDTRPLGSFLESHLPRSANISIPSLIFKRLRKSPNGHGSSWDSLGGFISTQAGRTLWDNLEIDRYMDVVIVGSSQMDELAKVLFGIMKGLIQEGKVQVLRGGWGSAISSSNIQDLLVFGETTTPIGGPSLATSLPPPKSAPAYDIPPMQPLPIPSTSSPSKGINHKTSLPSLRPENSMNRRNLPSLSINGGNGGSMNGPSTSRRTPKLSLNLDKPTKSATLGSFNLDHQPPPTPGGSFAASRSNLLSVNNRSQFGSIKSPRSPGFTINIPKTPSAGGSFQTICHAQSKLPPSPSSFGDIRHQIGQNEDIGPQPPKTPLPGSSFSKQSMDYEEADVLTTKNGLAPFVVSTILPSFLYLGPEISSKEDVEYLKKIGVKRILNVALECNDDSGLGLKDDFKYHRIPMRDSVEESGVGKGIRESCGFLDDARLHSAPTYVHCKAGKSRSVTVVLAYLIHANAWTLKTSYAYVSERRKGISPNIGFVAELMQFEENELGLKQSGGVHGDSTNHHHGNNNNSDKSRNRYIDDDDDNDLTKEDERRKQNNRTRESLPPTWSHSLNITSSANSSLTKSNGLSSISSNDPDKPNNKNNDNDKDEEDRKRRQVGDEREVRKNGQWVHHRRAPVDRTTLQPGRRVSKAGLESLRPLKTTSISPQKPSPTPSPGINGESKDNNRKHSKTPAGDGPLKWV